jgi:hypothetical protein
LETDLGDFTTDDRHFSRHEPTRVDDGSTDPHSINFESQTVAESMELCNNIEDDVMARNLETVADLEELCKMLIERLEIECHLKELQQSIKNCGPHAEAFVESERTHSVHSTFVTASGFEDAHTYLR